MIGTDHERQVLDLIVPTLKDAGYEVFTHPPRQLLPSFMQGYVPDAIALGKPKNLAIEIVQDGRPPARTGPPVADRFLGVPDWELRIYYARSGTALSKIEGVSPGVIERTIEKVETLIATGQTEAAILLGWSALEAIGRVLVPGLLPSAQSPARLIELLASEGIATPEEADRLRRMAALRNDIAHGALQTPIAAADLADFVAIVKLVRRENPSGASGS